MSTTSFQRILPTVLRFLMGLPLIAFGLMDAFHPMTPPPGMAEGAKAFSTALAATGYMMPMIGAVLAVGGLLLVLGRFVPLALLLLAPFWVNSLLFHLFLEHSGLVPAAVFTALELALAWQYRSTFAAVLKARNLPG
jgi:uncharacterized membrane protein YphA (DoxX/SURF4 family)